MKTVPEQLAYYELILREIASPGLEPVNRNTGNQPPYRWDFQTRVEPIENFATVELTSADFSAMNGMDDGQKTDYLLARFGDMLNTASLSPAG